MEEYEYPVGILDPAVKDKTSWFESLIEELNFDYPNLEFLAVGMIGSATGIKNTQYSSAPCRIEEWVTKSESYVTATGRTIEIFTGIISSPDNPALVDVIRGEEFQIYTSNYADSNSVFICPGTHSKWINTSNFEITNFQTFTTGELFQSLLTKSSISQLATNEITENDGKPESVILVGPKSNCETYRNACDFYGIRAVIDETTIAQRVARLVEKRSRLIERINS